MRSRCLARAAAIGAIAVALGTLAACTPAATSPRPTDAHLIVTDAVRATAALGSARLHAELVSTINGANFGQPGILTTTTAIDADVDIAGRQLAGRGTSAMAGAIGDMAPQGPQTSDVIVTTTTAFTRQGANAKWMKTGVGLNGGPTNAAIAAAIVGVLDDPRVTYEKADPIACTLGQCDHVIVHVNGAAVIGVLGPLMGMPANAPGMGAVPNFDVDIRISQTSSLISEVRTSSGAAGNTTQVLITLANPNDPVQIVAPPPGLVDDTLGGGMGGFGGGGVTTIVGTVGSEVESPQPMPVESDSSAP